MTPDMETPLWMLLLVALGLWLLWAAVSVSDRRRRSSMRLFVVLAERREDGPADDRPQDEKGDDDPQQSNGDAENDDEDRSLRVGHGVRILRAWELQGVPKGVDAYNAASAFVEAHHG
jgi:hypothetical protein